MALKLSVGVMAALGLPILVASVLAQTPSPDPRPRATPFPRSTGVGLKHGYGDDRCRCAPQEAPVAVQFYTAIPAGSPPGFTPSPRTAGTSYLSTAGMSGEEVGLAHESDQLARKLGEAKSDSDRAKLKDDLAQILEKQFDLRQKHHLDEIKALEEKIKKLKGLVDKRQENRREIVSNRLDQILRDAMGLGW